MTVAFGLIGQLFTAPTRKERVDAAAALVMWFSAGAFITSTLTSYLTYLPVGTTSDIVGGLLAVGVGTVLKAV